MALLDGTFGPGGPGSPLKPESPRVPAVPCEHKCDFKRASCTLRKDLHRRVFTMDGLDLKSNTHLLQGSLLLLADPSDLEAPGLPAGQRVTETGLR